MGSSRRDHGRGVHLFDDGGAAMRSVRRMAHGRGWGFRRYPVAANHTGRLRLRSRSLAGAGIVPAVGRVGVRPPSAAGVTDPRPAGRHGITETALVFGVEAATAATADPATSSGRQPAVPNSGRDNAIPGAVDQQGRRVDCRSLLPRRGRGSGRSASAAATAEPTGLSSHRSGM